MTAPGPYDFRRARGAIRPAPGTPPAEDVIRRIRDRAPDPFPHHPGDLSEADLRAMSENTELDAAIAAHHSLDDGDRVVIDEAYDLTEADLRRAIWTHDAPPEQVDIDAMHAWQAVQWPPHPRRRAVIAWVGLAIGLASVAAICISIGLLIESHL